MTPGPFHKAGKDEHLFIHSMGKRLCVTAIFTDTEQANAHMGRNDGDAVIAEFGPFILLANKHDRGLKT